MERGRHNYGRGRGGRDGRGRGRGGDGGGGGYHQAEQQYQRGDGGGGNRGRGGYQPQHQQQHYYQQEQGQGRGGGGGGRRGGYQSRGGGSASGGGGGRGGYHHQDQQQPPHHYQQQNRGGGRGGGGRGWSQQGVGGSGARVQEQESSQEWVRGGSVSRGRGGGGGRGGAGGAWGGGSWSGNVEASSSSAPLAPSQRPLKPLSESSAKEVSGSELPLRRPDKGGQHFIRKIGLLVNHFPVNFDPDTTILHYDVDIKQEMNGAGPSFKKPILKSDLRKIREKLGSDDPDHFPLAMTAYDGEKNIFSAVELPTGTYRVALSDGESTSRVYTFAIQLVNALKLANLRDYLAGRLPNVPRDILQGMDLVMKENPSRQRIPIGRSFYTSEPRDRDDLGSGVAAFRGLQQSLKPTSQGLALCLDYSVLSLYKRMGVLEFLRENGYGFQGANDVLRLRNEVINALKGLKVIVTHRAIQQRYTVSGLSDQNTRDISFDLEDPEGNDPPRRINIVEYFREKYQKDIRYLDIPCLNLGKNRINYVPMEFCIVAEGQRYPKEWLDRDTALFLKQLSLAPPRERKRTIDEMIVAEDGPCGEVAQNFGIEVSTEMTSVLGRVIGPPQLRLGAPNPVTVDREKCQWNLVGKSVVQGEHIERWALIDFSRKLGPNGFINNLRHRCFNLGINMEEPLVYLTKNMQDLSSVTRVRQILNGVVQEAYKKSGGRLQIIVCVMAMKDDGYKCIKYASEIEIGVVTQCCLSTNANKGSDQYLANLCLKINAKVGGSNFELIEQLPRFEGEDHVMFIGADVNHPSSKDKASPSIAAVVATVNWPAANRYAARVRSQTRRMERIENFGATCLELVKTYAKHNNGIRPKKIVIFRDGVSESQFDMVLNQELLDFQSVIFDDHYRPMITLIVAQKRHQTRLFIQNERDAGRSGNVPPGTVVDTTVVHPFEFDFYLCSHYGGLGTSKPTHYYVLWDDNGFSSDQLQKLIYNLCFTFARCTKPVSLVPPVYYADLVAYRGRLFTEVEMQSRSSVTTSLNLHRELEDIMFFV